MKSNTYQQLVSKMQEVSSIQPQTVGPFTPIYKRLVPYMKVSPWKVFIGGSFAATIAIYLLFGASIIYIVSLLQRGF